MKKFILWAVIILVAVGATLWGPIVSNVEQAKYTVSEAQGDMEIRRYAPMIVAETEVSGAREEAINQGFRRIADYIFGNNAPAQKVAMTAPVTQQGTGNAWKVRFVMPSSYTMESLPKPNRSEVKLHEMPARSYAVIRFSGLAGEKSLKEHTTRLQAFIRDKKMVEAAAPTYAFYNPPWTLPFLRRNEVMIDLKE
jgi:effector-binding domain-containing protein